MAEKLIDQRHRRWPVEVASHVTVDRVRHLGERELRSQSLLPVLGDWEPFQDLLIVERGSGAGGDVVDFSRHVPF